MLTGLWSARVEYNKPYPPVPTEIRRKYRTVELPLYTATVRADIYDARGKRLAEEDYPLVPAAEWKPFSGRFDKFPVGVAHMQYDLLTDRRGRQKSGTESSPDPFDPRFEAVTREQAEDSATPVRDDPNFVAWFVDLHRYVRSCHCGRALVTFLEERYPRIDKPKFCTPT